MHTVFIFVSCEEKRCLYRIVSLGHQNFDCRSYCGLSHRMQGEAFQSFFHKTWLLIRVEDTGYVTVEYRLTNLLSLLFSSFFCPFVPYCFTSAVSSTRSKSPKHSIL